MPAYDPEKSLTDNLAAFGYQHAPASNGRRDVVSHNGEVVFTGHYEATAAWLKAHNARGERPTCEACLRPVQSVENEGAAVLYVHNEATQGNVTTRSVCTVLR